MSFFELMESKGRLEEISRVVAKRALNEPSAPITNSGITPSQLLDRLSNSTIDKKVLDSNSIDNLGRALVQAVDDLEL